jgi:hypothetical protein
MTVLKPLTLAFALLAFVAVSQAQALETSPAASSERTLASQVDSSDWSYQYLKGLSARGGLSRPFPQDGRTLSRADMALFAADAARMALGDAEAGVMMADVPALPPLPGEPPASATAAPQDAAPFTPTATDKDAAYKLVQQYQEELMKMGAKLTAIEDQLVALKTRNDELSDKIDKVLKMTGLKINGEAVVKSVNVMTMGQRRMWEPSQRDPRDNRDAYANTGAAAYYAKAYAGGTQYERDAKGNIVWHWSDDDAAYDPKNTTGQGEHLQNEKAQRIWPTVGYMDMNINARPRPNLYAEMIYRMQTLFGAYWGSQNLAGVRRFRLRADTPVAFTVGMLDYKNTPLTVWANEDQDLYLLPLDAKRVRENMNDLFLGDNRWPINGALAETTLLWGGGLDQYMQVMGSKLGTFNQKSTGLPYGEQYSFDQYLYGGRTSITFPARPSSFESLNAFGDAVNLTLGGNYFEIKELPDTQTTDIRTSGEQFNNVVSGDMKLSFAKDKIYLQGEWARANYNPDMGYGQGQGATAIEWNSGTAGNVHFILDGFGTKSDLFYSRAEADFINYAAQSRTRDWAGDNLMGRHYSSTSMNNLYNPSNAGYGFTTQEWNWLSRYNAAIAATNKGAAYKILGYEAPDASKGIPTGRTRVAQAGGVYIPHDPTSNNSLPYGEATPNRDGFGWAFSGKYLKDILQPSLGGAYYQEISPAWYLGSVAPEDYNVETDNSAVGVGDQKNPWYQDARRSFIRGNGGLKVDLAGLETKWLNVAVFGGYAYEKTQDAIKADRNWYDKNGNTLAGKYHLVDLISQTSSVGLEYTLLKKFRLMTGFRCQQVDGSEFYNVGGGIGAYRYQWAYLASLIETTNYALSWDIGKATTLTLGYSNTKAHQFIMKVDDPLATGEPLMDMPFEMQEGDLILRVKF